MSFPPMSSPAPFPETRRSGSGPTWNTAAAGVVGVLVILYIAASIVQILMQRQGAADAAAVSAALSGPSSSSNLHSLDGTIQSHIATMHTVNGLYQLSFWAMFIAFFGWYALLSSRLRAMGRTFNRRSMKAWWVWRAGVLLSIIMVFVANGGGTPSSPDEAIPVYNRLTAYFAVRAVVGVAYLWVVYSAWRAAGSEFAASDAARTGYPSPAQGYPPYYPPAPPAYYPPPVQGAPPTRYGPAPWPAPPPPNPYPAQPPPNPYPAQPAGDAPPS